jgi:hypothetical protein
MKTKLLLAICVWLLTGCFKEITWEPEPWTHHYAGPVVKTALSLNSLTNLQKIKLVDDILSLEVNSLWSGPMIVPPINGLNSRSSAQVFELTEYFKAIHTDSLDIQVDFTNKYPIPIGQGTELVFENVGNGQVFYRHSIGQTVAPNSTYTFHIEVSKKADEPLKVESNVMFYLDNFRSSGSNGQVVDFTDASTVFAFGFEFISVRKLELYPSKEWTDTVPASVSIFGAGAEPQKILEGSIMLAFRNGLPIQARAQVMVLDEQGNTIDSLFQEAVTLKPGTIDPLSYDVLEEGITEAKADLSFDQLALFYSERDLEIIYRIHTPDDPAGVGIVLNEQSMLRLKLMLDFTLYVDQIEIE